MPRRPCSICARPDIDLLVEMVKNGASARHVAQKHGLHPRVFQQCLARHRANPLGRKRASLAGHAARAAIVAEVNTLAEARTLFNRAVKFLDSAIESDSQRDARAWMAECRECLKLAAQANGELSTAPSVNIALGVSIDKAKAAVEAVEVAEALPPQALADRAVAYLTAYNADHPDDRRSV